jgi:ABC-type sugar transport system permease subunit
MSFPAPQGVELIVWTVIFTIIITAVMVLRFWAVAIVLKRSLRLDDYFIILAYVCIYTSAVKKGFS